MLNQKKYDRPIMVIEIKIKGKRFTSLNLFYSTLEKLGIRLVFNGGCRSFSYTLIRQKGMLS